MLKIYWSQNYRYFAVRFSFKLKIYDEQSLEDFNSRSEKANDKIQPFIDQVKKELGFKAEFAQYDDDIFAPIIEEHLLFLQHNIFKIIKEYSSSKWFQLRGEATILAPDFDCVLNKFSLEMNYE